MKVPKTESTSIQNTGSATRQRTGLISSPLHGSVATLAEPSVSNNQTQQFLQIQQQD